MTNANILAVVDSLTCATTLIDVTRDSASGPVRRIRGLAFDSAHDVMYGITREGVLVTVNRNTAQTKYLWTVSSGSGSPPNFWSGLAYDGLNKLYTTNAFAAHQLIAIQLANPTTVAGDVVVGSTLFAGSARQILGLDIYPASAPPWPGHTPGVLYGSNRTNQNFVVVDRTTGAVTMPFGNASVGVNNPQEIAFEPTSGLLYTIHDHHSSSNNAALSISLTLSKAFEFCQLPFGIVESVGGGNDTYGWGGLAFAK